MTTIRQVIQDKNHYWEIHLTEDDIEDEVKKITKRREKMQTKTNQLQRYKKHIRTEHKRLRSIFMK